MSRPTVLICLAHYKPGWKFGGPTRTIANLVDHLGGEIDFRVLTSDRDFGDDVPFQGVSVDRWQSVGRAQVFYMSANNRRLVMLAKILNSTPCDALYLNSFFHPNFSIKPLMAMRLGLAKRRRVVLAPRGEFAPSALAIKAKKKSAFLSFSRWSGLHRDVHWQASSAFEADDISRVLGSTARDIKIATNLPAPLLNAADVLHPEAVSGAPLRVVLVSRISRMKNVAFALEAVRHSPVPVDFDIWGTLEDQAYWETCQTLMTELPPHVSVTYRGPAPHDQVATILAASDLMILPSLGENFGHGIAEALSAGTPVLISDRTPWRGLADANVGWDLPIDHGVEEFAAALGESLSRREAEGKAWRDQVRAYARTHLPKPEDLEANRCLFQFTEKTPMR